MKRQTPDPLSPEERALADRLARLGPHEGPSPALDAKILAAAHAAAAASPRAAQGATQRARRRWALSAIPGSLITGAGIAATLALAVGVVWQLRPIAPSREAPSHESGDAYTAAEMIQRPRQTIAPPPPPLPAEDAAAPSAARMEQRELPVVAQAPAAAKPSADVARTAQAFPEPAPPESRRQRSAPAAATESAAYGEIAQDAASPAPMAAPPMPAPAPAPAAAPTGGAAREDNFGLVPSRARIAADAAKARNDAAEAKQTAAYQERREAGAAQQGYSAQREAEARESVTLDRIEVTGSRIKRADIEPAQPVADLARAGAFPPVSEDQRLDRSDWLERIRARRDAGQLDEARSSLAAFRKAHPRARVPDDLRALQPR